jgi:aspartyl/glutamyl-tRNA(Asn/Gln) amidotransferase C subunit
MLSKEDVRYIAALSRIHLEEDQVEYLTKDLADILGYIDKLKEVDVTGIQPTSHVLPIQNVFREDVIRSSLDQKEVLRMAVSQHNGSFKVPQVIE